LQLNQHFGGLYARQPIRGRGNMKRGIEILRCGAQTPNDRLRGHKLLSYLVPAKAATGRLAPQRRNLFPRSVFRRIQLSKPFLPIGNIGIMQG